MKLTIKRIAKTGYGTFGVLLDDFGFPFALTAERPWLENKSNESCIPAGEYRCAAITSPKFGKCIEVLNVPDRSHILFHKGNVPMKDSHGCILVGEQFESLGKQHAVLSSRKGFSELMGLIEGIDEFDLVIMEV